MESEVVMNDPNSTSNTSQPANAFPAVQPPVIQLCKILIPIDFSPSSLKALRYGIAFANQFKSGLTLINVVEFSFAGSEFGAAELSQIEADLRESARKQMEDLVKTHFGMSGTCKTLITCGRPYAEITQAARDEHADLIIIATHGHSSLTHVLLGSTVERVVRHAPCPVLVVRKEEHDFVQP